MYIDPNVELKEVRKTIQVCLNSSKEIRLVKVQLGTYDAMRKSLRAQLKLPFRELRIFTSEGVEIYREDLAFMKDGMLVHVTEGQEFSQQNSFQIYEIVKELGEGGFGKVQLGRHRLSGQLIAMKFIDTSKIGNAQDIDMVFREAELMKSLRHRNIVQIHNCYTLPNMQVVILMEYLQGGELLQYLEKKGRLSEDEARGIIAQIIEAMSYCHSQKLIHRDLKLENILFQSLESGIVKVVDFGIAGVASNLNVDKVDMGSLGYMAPEVLSGQVKTVGPSVDIWAIGVILYALVIGELPFTRSTQKETLNSIINTQYAFPLDLPLSPEIRNFISSIFIGNHHQRAKLSELQKHPWMTPRMAQFAQTLPVNTNRRKTLREGGKVSFGGGMSSSQNVVKGRGSVLMKATANKIMTSSLNKEKDSMVSSLNMPMVSSVNTTIIDEKRNHNESSSSSCSSLEKYSRTQQSKLITKDYTIVVDRMRSQIKPFRVDLKSFLKQFQEPHNDYRKTSRRSNYNSVPNEPISTSQTQYVRRKVKAPSYAHPVWHDFNLQRPWHERIKDREPEMNYRLQTTFLGRKRIMDAKASNEYFSNVYRSYLK